SACSFTESNGSNADAARDASKARAATSAGGRRRRLLAAEPLEQLVVRAAEVERPRYERVDRRLLVGADAFISRAELTTGAGELGRHRVERRRARDCAQMTDLHLRHALTRVAKTHEVEPAHGRRVQVRDQRADIDLRRAEAREDRIPEGDSVGERGHR